MTNSTVVVSNKFCMCTALVPTIGYLLSAIEMTYIRDLIYEIVPVTPKKIELVKTDSPFLIKRSYSCDSAAKKITCGTESDSAIFYRCGNESATRPPSDDAMQHQNNFIPLEHEKEDVELHSINLENLLSEPQADNSKADCSVASEGFPKDTRGAGAVAVSESTSTNKHLAAWSEIFGFAKNKMLKLSPLPSELSATPKSNSKLSLHLPSTSNANF
jgi:hypothetical protein